MIRRLFRWLFGRRRMRPVATITLFRTNEDAARRVH